MKKKSFGRKLLAFLLVFSMLAAPVPNLGTETAEAASSYSLTETNAGDYHFKSGRFMQIYHVVYNDSMRREDAFLANEGSCSEMRDAIKMYKADGFIVYCMEHGVAHRSTSLYKRNYKDSAVYYGYSSYTGQSEPYPLNNIFKVLLFAPVTGSTIKELDDLGFAKSEYRKAGTSYTVTDWYVASQMLVWECQQMMRDEDFNRRENGLRYETGYRTGVYTTPIPKDHYLQNLQGTNAKDIYNFMASEVKKRSNMDGTLVKNSEKKPKVIKLSEEESKKTPVVKEISAGSYQGEYKVVDKKGKKLKGISLTYDKAGKKYILKITDSALLNQTLEVKHADAAAERAEKYRTGAKGDDYKQYVWEHATRDGHTQGFVSGLEDPVSGWLKIVKTEAGPEPEGPCTPPDVEKFPTVSIPIEKIDANDGWDGDAHTPLGGAGLDAVYTLYRKIAGGSWEVLDTLTLDQMGSEAAFSDQPFTSREDLVAFLRESGSVTGCTDHPIYDEEGNITGYEHEGQSRQPAGRNWDVTVNYRIVETRPDGRYIDPDPYGGVREYAFHYEAEAHDTCTQFCQSLPWSEVEYTFTCSTTTGAGVTQTEGPAAAPAEDLSFEKETFVNDSFRGDVLIIKSNEKENPFKDSALGGDRSNISTASCWQIKLVDGIEGMDFVQLKSENPEILPGGTHQYTASRGTGVPNHTLNGGLGMKVGTNGQILIKDLPYGTYEITEVKADDPKYVPEKFTLVVSEHDGGSAERIAYGSKGSVPESGRYAGYAKTGTNAIGSVSAGTGDYYNNRYDVNLRDKIKSNVVKIAKVDSETGKQIPLKGTKVFIRYKGNPDRTDEENIALFGPSGSEAKNVLNRFLPNAESIDSKSTNYTFELNENGELTIPYQLPYGTYEVYEWLLPEGYFVGKYGADGKGKNHNFGYIEEGHKYEDVVAIFDSEGKKVRYKEKDRYSFEELDKMVTNRYTFVVQEQKLHEDGNFSQLVTSGGSRMDADPTYDGDAHPYENNYRIFAVLNNSVKGKIEITKEGEALVGFNKEEKEGYTVLRPVFETISRLKDAVFGIFAAEDENLKDGSEGPDIFDSKTEEKISLEKTVMTHLSGAVETVKAFVGKLLSPKSYQAAKYETGEYSHESGAELWYMLEREASEGNVKRTLYVSPEQKDTTYSYVYETRDTDYQYRYDVEVILKNQAGGANVTRVNVTKTTSPISGFVPEIPMTYMRGRVGSTAVDDAKGEIQSYEKGKIDDFDWTPVSELDVYKKLYVFEADGERDTFLDGTEIDLSEPCPERYLVKDYVYYMLTAEDLAEETRKVGTRQVTVTPGVDANGDGDFEDPEDTLPVYGTEDILETRTVIEWNHEGYVLSSPKRAGGKAILKKDGEDIYRTAVTGYYTAGEKTSLIKEGERYDLMESDAEGEEIAPYTIPSREGWSRMPFTGDPKEDPQYVIIVRTEGENTEYKVLLDDLESWQECRPNGNFEKMRVQVYEADYTQQKEDPDGFTVFFDGFALGAAADPALGTAQTTITKQDAGIAETISMGAGYEKENTEEETVFRTIPIAAPIYFAWENGIKADMYFKGGVCYAAIEMPASAIEHRYGEIVPTLNFIHYNAENEKMPLKLDWYSKLTPENPVVNFTNREGLSDGVRVTARRVDKAAAGAETMYYLEIVTNQTEETPLELTFADGYTMDIYCAQAASGNGVGVLDLSSVYKTTRYTQSALVDTITTGNDGKAVSRLLPLGKYIIRELSADGGYVNDSKPQVAELRYADQFTPLIWADKTFKNRYFEVQLDVSKVFEAGFRSETYQPPKEGETVKFGLYAAEEITAAGKGILSVFTKTIKKDSLLDVLTVTCEHDGTLLADVKLPEGNYYLKELEAPEEYLMSRLNYYFTVKEEEGDYSEDADFDYRTTDGIYGRFVLSEKNLVKTAVMIEKRLPMPEITIDDAAYPLDENLKREDGGITISADADYTAVTVETRKDETTEIVLPNGKQISVKLGESGNTYDYTVDGVTRTFTPKGTYTGYDAEYEELWKPAEGETLTMDATQFTLSGAGSDKAEVILKAEVRHEPDFKHSAAVTVTDDTDANVILQTFERTSAGKTVTEALNPSGMILLSAKDEIRLQTRSGAIVTVSLDKYGVASASIENTLPQFFTEAAHPEVSSTGAFNPADTFHFSKNVTLGRQDTSADKLMIKINSDNKDTFAVENAHKPEVKFVKVDKKDAEKKLSGAVFEIYSAKPSGEWTVEPDALLGTYTTEAGGTFQLPLDYGTYFYKEVKAPVGYKAEDREYHIFRVAKGLPKYEVTVENEKLPEIPGNSPAAAACQLELKKVDKETGESLAGAEFELWSAKLAEDGATLVPGEKLLKENLVTGKYGVVQVAVSKAEAFFYREVKAPNGYLADSRFHLIEMTAADLLQKVVVENEKIKEPFIRTRAAGKDGEKVIAAGKNVTIVDEVTYENLIPGKEYTLKGRLMDKETGRVIIAKGKKVTAEKTFTPEYENGSVELVFSFDASQLESLNTVVFEELYLGAKLVAEHTDIEDENQTVEIEKRKPSLPKKPEKPEKPENPGEVPKTGDTAQGGLYLFLIALAISFLILFLFIGKKYEKGR